MDSSSKKKTSLFGSFLWAFLERIGAQGVGVIINIVLARLLVPEDYGILAVMVIFTNLANQLVLNGFNTSLIQNKDVTDEDYSSVLNISWIFSVLLYAILYFCAPWIAGFYNIPALVLPLRVLALLLFPSVLQSVQTAKLRRDMDFKQLFQLTILASLIGGGVGVGMAYAGLGVWALVGQQLAGSICTCIVLWVKLKWRPQLVINWTRVGVLFSYGWKLLAASLLNTLYADLTGLVIGKKYTPTMLAYYDKGQMLPSKLLVNINDSIQNVMLPALSKVQDDRARCKEMMRRSVQVSCFIIFPMMAGLAAVTEPVVIILLTEKWLPCVPFMQLACLNHAFYPVHTANLQAMKAMGRSDMFLKLEIIKKAIGLAALIIPVVFFDSVLSIVWCSTLTIPLTLLINMIPNQKIVGYSPKEQLGDILPSMVLAVGMFFVVQAIGNAGNIWIKLIVKVLFGVIFYTSGALILRFKVAAFLLQYVKDLLHCK